MEQANLEQQIQNPDFLGQKAGWENRQPPKWHLRFSATGYSRNMEEEIRFLLPYCQLPIGEKGMNVVRI